MSAKAVATLQDRRVPVDVHIASGLLDKIAAVALDGYLATAHGGLEVGGVLFGRREGGFVTVERFRPLPCDHSQGPRFILSDGDQQSLREMLAFFSNDLSLRGFEIVGWYCSHTRSDLEVLDRELLLHDSYFPAQDNLLILLKPRNLQRVTAAIFMRHADGMLDRHCPSKTVELAEVGHAKPALTRADCDLVAFPSDADACTPPEPPAGLQRLPAPIDEDSVDRPATRPLRPEYSAADEVKESAGPAKWRIALAVLGTMAVMCFAGWRLGQIAKAHKPPVKPPPTDLAVSLRPEAGKLVLSWKTNVARAQQAGVDISAAAATEHVDLTGIFQPVGVVILPPTPGTVEAVLTVETANGVLVRRASFTNSTATNQTAADSAADNAQPSAPAHKQTHRYSARKRHKKRT